MSEVKRYQADWHGMFLDLPGRRMGTEERLVVLASDFDRVTAERDAALEREAEALAQLSTWDHVLRSSVPEEHKHPFSPVAAVQNYISEIEQRLTAADERADVMEGLLRLLAELPGVRTSGIWERVVAALKPAEGGGDEQG